MTGESMSIEEKRAYNPRLTKIKELVAKRARLQLAIATIDMEINRLVCDQPAVEDHATVTMADDENDSGTAKRNPQTLPFVVHEILLKDRLTLRDLVAAILRSGYKTKSKNFSSCVQQVIQQLRNAQAIKKDDQTRQYFAVRVSKNVLAERLSEQTKDKRQSRTRREVG